MSDLPSPENRSLLIAAGIMFLIGWLGLILLWTITLPTVGPRWLFFFLWTLAITGIALPFVWLLHRRFSPNQQARASVLLRQGMFIGLFAAICVWLQINHSLTLGLAVLLAIGLIAIEWFLRLIERSTWKPNL
jgi:undecaprenyl pyrophosphate phosphatase UppP